MMSRKNEEPLSLLQATRAHQASSKYNTVLWSNQTKTGSNALIFKRTTTIRRYLYQQNKALTFPCNLFAKSYITSEIMKWYSCMIRKREVKQTVTWSSLYNISDSHNIQMNRTNPNYLMNFLKHFFSPFCIFHSFVDSCGITEISSHVTWRGVYPRITTQTLMPLHLWC